MQGTHQPKIIEKIVTWQMEHALEKAADRLRDSVVVDNRRTRAEGRR